jgi:hypothetical protein
LLSAAILIQLAQQAYDTVSRSDSLQRDSISSCLNGNEEDTEAETDHLLNRLRISCSSRITEHKDTMIICGNNPIVSMRL